MNETLIYGILTGVQLFVITIASMIIGLVSGWLLIYVAITLGININKKLNEKRR